MIAARTSAKFNLIFCNCILCVILFFVLYFVTFICLLYTYIVLISVLFVSQGTAVKQHLIWLLSCLPCLNIINNDNDV